MIFHRHSSLPKFVFYFPCANVFRTASLPIFGAPGTGVTCSCFPSAHSHWILIFLGTTALCWPLKYCIYVLDSRISGYPRLLPKFVKVLGAFPRYTNMLFYLADPCRLFAITYHILVYKDHTLEHQWDGPFTFVHHRPYTYILYNFVRYIDEV